MELLGGIPDSYTLLKQHNLNLCQIDWSLSQKTAISGNALDSLTPNEQGMRVNYVDFSTSKWIYRMLFLVCSALSFSKSRIREKKEILFFSNESN